LFGQNDTHLIADVVSDLSDAKKAKATASALGALMLIAKNSGKLKEDELLLLKSAKIKSEGTLLRITFNLDKPEAQKMIIARLADYKRKKAEEARKTGESKPSGQLNKTDLNSNAGK